jgi:hypothetical protein
MFLAELFFMGVVFAGVALLIRYVLQQTMTPEEEAGPREHREFFPLLEKHQQDGPRHCN